MLSVSSRSSFFPLYRSREQPLLCMASKSVVTERRQPRKENVSGDFFVDHTCIGDAISLTSYLPKLAPSRLRHMSLDVTQCVHSSWQSIRRDQAARERPRATRQHAGTPLMSNVSPIFSKSLDGCV